MTLPYLSLIGFEKLAGVVSLLAKGLTPFQPHRVVANIDCAEKLSLHVQLFLSHLQA